MISSSPSAANAKHEGDSSRDATEPIDLESLFTEMQPRLLRAARRWAPAEAVDDAVQDTWIGVINGVDRFEGRSKISTWVFGILWRQCCKQWRRVGSAPMVDGQQLDIESNAPDVDPSRIAEGRESLRRTFDAIDTLPGRYREIILLRDILDQPAPETCQLLDISQANQRVLHYRARNRIREALPDLVAS